jgi:hypothetical protein
MGTDDRLVHREVMELQATPAQVLEFVMTPERIFDYFIPAALEAGEFEPGRSIWCRSEGAICMLELVDEESTDDRRVLLVTTAFGLEPPFTPEGIRAATAFTMIEDWAVAPGPDGATLTKAWRDVTTVADFPFPLEDAIRESAKSESAPLIERWNAAARAGT